MAKKVNKLIYSKKINRKAMIELYLEADNLTTQYLVQSKPCWSTRKQVVSTFPLESDLEERWLLCPNREQMNDFVLVH